jgi:hypothetical protein
MNYFKLHNNENTEAFDSCVNWYIHDIIKEIISGKNHSTHRMRVVAKKRIELEIKYHIPDRLVLHFELLEFLDNGSIIIAVAKYDHTLYPILEMRKHKIRKLNLL